MNVLAIGAHPDDLEILMGGTLAKYSKRGDNVFMAVATNGEVGSATLPKKEIAEIRRQEALDSANVIGAKLFWMDFPDEFLFDTQESRLKFIDVIRQCNPNIVFCHYSHDYHPDHQISGQIVTNIKVMTTVPNIKTPTPVAEKIPDIYYFDTLAGINFVPEEFVDITDTFKIKKEMLSKHKSQSGWLVEQYGISYLEFIEVVARFRGIQTGVTYAEGFKKAVAWPIKKTVEMLP